MLRRCTQGSPPPLRLAIQPSRGEEGNETDLSRRRRGGKRLLDRCMHLTNTEIALSRFAYERFELIQFRIFYGEQSIVLLCLRLFQGTDICTVWYCCFLSCTTVHQSRLAHTPSRGEGGIFPTRNIQPVKFPTKPTSVNFPTKRWRHFKFPTTQKRWVNIPYRIAMDNGQWAQERMFLPAMKIQQFYWYFHIVNDSGE